MDISGAGSSSNRTPSPTRPRLTMDVEGRPSPTPPRKHLAGHAVIARRRGPRTMEEIYEDFSACRSALVRALATDQEELYGLLCEPGRQALCLYGHADGSWELRRPEELAPPDMPEPALGVNFLPDHMSRFAWLQFIAQHADSWLFGVAFFFAASLDANNKMSLFNLMNNLPTINRTFYHYHKAHWLATSMPPSPDLMQNVYNPNIFSSAPAQENVPRSADLLENVSNPNTESITPAEENMPLLSQDSIQNMSDPNKNSRTLAVDDEDGHEVSERCFCGICGDPYHANGFWICCNVCDMWFHGRCVKITASQAEHIKVYKCPDCTCDEHIRE